MNIKIIKMIDSRKKIVTRFSSHAPHLKEMYQANHARRPRYSQFKIGEAIETSSPSFILLQIHHNPACPARISILFMNQ